MELVRGQMGGHEELVGFHVSVNPTMEFIYTLCKCKCIKFIYIHVSVSANVECETCKCKIV